MHRSTRGCHALKIASLELSTKLKRCRSCRAYQLEKKEREEKEEEKKEEEKKEELNEEKKEEKK